MPNVMAHDICVGALDDVNRKKNRYEDRLPYEHNKVELSIVDDDGSRYVNGSYMSGPRGPKSFIALQGAMTNTMNSIWNVAYGEKSDVLVMVSDLKEGKEVKVSKYFPDYGNELCYGPFNVKNKFEKTFKNHTFRKFTVTMASPQGEESIRKEFSDNSVEQVTAQKIQLPNTPSSESLSAASTSVLHEITESIESGIESGKSSEKSSDLLFSKDAEKKQSPVQNRVTEHVVYQFHFEGWKDQGPPEDRLSLASLIEAINKCHTTGPIITHCSGGFGRTGTTILAANLLADARGDIEVDALGRLYKMRNERVYVVEESSQFLCCLDLVRDICCNPETAAVLQEYEAWYSDVFKEASEQ